MCGACVRVSVRTRSHQKIQYTRNFILRRFANRNNRAIILRLHVGVSVYVRVSVNNDTNVVTVEPLLYDHSQNHIGVVV